MDRALGATEYRLLVEHAPVMVWRAGLDAKCDYFNQTWLDYTGRTMAQELGDGWAEGVHPEDFQRCLALYLDHFERRQAFEMEYRLRCRDGSHRWILDRGVPYTDDSGAFAGFIGSCVDVDQRRKAQDAQQQHDREQLELARDFEKWILAIVGHDIRDPLNTIQLAAHMLGRVPDATPAVRKQAENVTRAVSRIRHIVGDLLDLSREREGQGISVHPAPTDMRKVCQHIIEEVRGIATDRLVTFECQVDGEGAWDEQRILQAISNLASNAVQHGTPGSPVNLRLTGDAERVSVEVRNEGAIALEVLPQLFEPFRSGRHHGGRGQGLGLGLFIAKAIAQAHGGDLEVDSAQGATIFRLVLPRHTAA
ncbi:PAS domain-containing sensor histidine kinase [Ramlibacter sp. XY19]|uniref:PAS domain-containing sensor histidine kinase n=1 Tax=Ramlibacter paludis TaxID=2908000 RepID=UPI0023D9C2D8|nr:PAS domain-containing sensor histidine kinase [Ramlibacter paludis]MCG2594430.1 PAS domain-containing sensor histidine kinase [Ramlibacter paludis]